MQKLLGNYLYDNITSLCPLESIREIRIRKNQKIQITAIDFVVFLPIIATSQIINNIVAEATNHSKYAFETEISEGYIDYGDGIRIGLIGRGGISSGGQLAYTEIYSLCIRLPHNIVGLSEEITNLLNDGQANILIISPPGAGKTTLLRNIANFCGEKTDTLIVDERGEVGGINLNYITGKRIDIIQGIKKEVIFENIVRTMSPELVICDEIFSAKDIEAIKRIINAGIRVIATYHASTIETVPFDLKNVFNGVITLTSKPRVGSISSIMRIQC